jgi:hypothetical protein
MKMVIRFSDLVKEKQDEFLSKAKLSIKDLGNPDNYIVTNMDINPEEYMTIEEFFNKVKDI